MALEPSALKLTAKLKILFKFSSTIPSIYSDILFKTNLVLLELRGELLSRQLLCKTHFSTGGFPLRILPARAPLGAGLGASGKTDVVRLFCALWLFGHVLLGKNPPDAALTNCSQTAAIIWKGLPALNVLDSFPHRQI